MIRFEKMAERMKKKLPHSQALGLRKEHFPLWEGGSHWFLPFRSTTQHYVSPS